MRFVKLTLPKELKEIEIHIFSDWHIGDKSCKYDEILQNIEEIKANENAFIICNGDLMNNATKTSVSDSYAEIMTPQEQIDKLCDLLLPVKDKILIMTQGNHEARTYRSDGIDLTAIVAGKLGILENYVREAGILFLRVGEQNRKRHSLPVCYSFYVTHGTGGGKKEGAKAIRLADMANIVDTDIYIHSHTHLPMIMKESYFRVDKTRFAVMPSEKLFVNSSASLDYGGYGQTYEFKPASRTSPIIHLSGECFYMKATL